MKRRDLTLMESIVQCDKYKNLNLPWLRQIPVDWNYVPLKYLKKKGLYTFVDGPFGSDLKNEEQVEKGIPLIQLNNISSMGSHLIQNMKYITSEKAEQLSKHKIYPQDIVIAKMAEPVARAAIVKSIYKEYVIVADCIKFAPNTSKVDPRFLVFAMNSHYFRSNAEMLATGSTRLRVNLSIVKNLSVALPKLEEQRAIVQFLEHEVEKLDKLVIRKEKIIKLLEEKQQSVIEQGVTKGFQQNVEMKELRNEWIRELPQHWKLKSLKYCLENGSEGIKIGPFGSSLKLDEMEQSGFKVYGQENIINNNFDLGSRYINKEKFQKLSVYEIKPGNILISMMGTIGKCKVVPKEIEDGIMDSHLIRVNVKKNLVLPEYLAMLIEQSNFVQDQLKANSKGSIMSGLNSTLIKSVVLALPPVSEQEQILNAINKFKERTRILVGKLNDQILKIKEYRQSLISAAVTGEINISNQ